MARQLEVLNRSDTPPFHHDEAADEDLRLRYRYLDLRRPEMLRNLRLRHRVTSALRRFLDTNGFVDVETPMLTKATPEGARDYLVPARNFPGKFFALPQSPQLFKQLLMMSGLDRYYQIARCFRDEDLRADRQPEFTQLDVETSFMDEDDITALMEQMVRELFREVLDVELPDPFPRMSWAEAMARFGTDRPDLRIPLELVEVADLVASVEFKVFAGPAADPNGRVAALRVPGGGSLTRKEIDDVHRFRRPLRRARPGLHQGQRRCGRARRPAVADPQVPARRGRGRDHVRAPGRRPATWCSSAPTSAKVVNDALGALRDKLGIDLGLLADRLAPAVGGRFPDVRVGRQARSAGSRCTTPSPRRRSTITPRCRRDPGKRCRAPTTWC